MTRDAGGVVLIGLDGADWRLLTPFIDSGAMPNLQRIVEQGTSGRLAAPAIPQVDVAWTCALTGVHAHVHGIVDIEVPAGDGLSVRRTSAADRCVPLAWEIAARAGCECVHVGWGSVIGEGGVEAGAFRGDGPYLVPNGTGELRQQLAEAVDPRDRALADRYRALMRESESTARNAVAAMRERPWRLAAVRFAAFGELLVDFARFMPPAPAWVLPRRATMFAAAVERACALHDALIGQLIAAAGDGPLTAVVASPRGTPLERLRSDPAAARTASLPNRPAGIIAISGGDVPRDALTFGCAALDLCPTLLAVLGCVCPAHVQGRAAKAIGVSGELTCTGVRPDAGDPARTSADGTATDEMPPEVRSVARRCTMARADSYADAGQVREAAEVMARLADAWPADAHVALRCVELLRDAGQCGAAAARLARLPVVPPELMEVRAMVEASLCAQEERHRDALEVLQREQLRQESMGGGVGAALHVARARSQMALGLLAEAERSCEMALADEPDRRDAHVAHAQVLYAAERYADATGAGMRAIALAHFDPQMHFLVGTALAALGRAEEAVAELSIAVGQDPGLVAAYRRLAAVHLRQLGDVDAARRYAALAGEARAVGERSR